MAVMRQTKFGQDFGLNPFGGAGRRSGERGYFLADYRQSPLDA
jgi:hypothetical protein